MKPAEIQNFQRVFFLAHLAKNCNFMKLDIFYSVVFQSLMKKATKCSLFPFISTFCVNHLQRQKIIFAFLIEGRTKSLRNFKKCKNGIAFALK